MHEYAPIIGGVPLTVLDIREATYILETDPGTMPATGGGDQTGGYVEHAHLLAARVKASSEHRIVTCMVAWCRISRR